MKQFSLILVAFVSMRAHAGPSERAERPRTVDPLSIAVEPIVPGLAAPLPKPDLKASPSAADAGEEAFIVASPELSDGTTQLDLGGPSSESAPLPGPDHFERARQVSRDLYARLNLSPDSASTNKEWIDGVAAECCDQLASEMPLLYHGEARMKLDPSGAVALDDEGFPEPRSYETAFRAGKLAESIAGNSVSAAAASAWLGSDEALLKRLAAVWSRTFERRYAGENRLALVKYREPETSYPGGQNNSIDEYILTERFLAGGWWISSSMAGPAAPHGYAYVTERKISPSLKGLGPGAYTRIYWPRKKDVAFRYSGPPDPKGIHVRENYDATHQRRTREVIAPVGRDDEGEIIWKEFFYKNIGGHWALGDPSRVKAADRCIVCHVQVNEKGEAILDAQGKPRLSPLPRQLRTKAQFLAVGYEDTPLVDAYLEMIAAANRKSGR